MKKNAIIVTVVGVITIIVGISYFDEIKPTITVAVAAMVGVILAMLDADSKAKSIHLAQSLIHLAMVVGLINFVYKYTIIIVPLKESIIVYIVASILTNIILAL